MLVFHFTLLYRSHSVVELRQHFWFLEIPYTVAACERLDGCDDYSSADCANLRKSVHFGFEINPSTLDLQAHVASELPKDDVGVASKNTAWLIGCDVTAIFSDCDEIRSIKLFDVPALLSVEVQADWKAFTLCSNHAFQVCSVVASSLAIATSLGRRSIVVVTALILRNNFNSLGLADTGMTLRGVNVPCGPFAKAN
eukprot:TRINITY_DN28415_c0_g1_i1.p1 TRINITY_DN28415_c0_g1~~TRINITY_DN28415_c0_g1_i1.p1  ORF type:complete len:197 (+),score=19.74 TRINITY_DN28415_c0_g1_i1:560-1150(+)